MRNALVGSSRIIVSLMACQALHAQTELARDIFRQLIEINTTHSTGDNTAAARAMAARFREAGFAESDIYLLEPAPRKGNLIVRFRGTGKGQPILFLGHLDVVEALRSDWSFDPFVFREQDGYFYGRGTQDMKGDVAILVANFLRLRKEGFRPSRDLILALTADEESGPVNGVDWLVKNRRDLIDAAYCLNPDSGGGLIRNAKREYLSIQTAEKTTASFLLTVTGPGGHSSLPRSDNPIYELAAGLVRLAGHKFPVKLNEVTRESAERMAVIEQGQRAADFRALLNDPPDAAAAARLSESAVINARLHTTCIATLISGGHASNAIPQTATATVNCRILPNDSVDDVRRTIVEVLANPNIKVTNSRQGIVSPVSPMAPEVRSAVKDTAAGMWPGVEIVTVMEAGATDGKYLRIAGIPTFGVSGLFTEAGDFRAHGKDERLKVSSFYDGLEFMYRLMKQLSAERP